jgi:hypothetical protein
MPHSGGNNHHPIMNCSGGAHAASNPIIHDRFAILPATRVAI